MVVRCAIGVCVNEGQGFRMVILVKRVAKSFALNVEVGRVLTLIRMLA